MIFGVITHYKKELTCKSLQLTGRPRQEGLKMKAHELHKSLNQLTTLQMRLDKIRQDIDREADVLTDEPEGTYLTHEGKANLYNNLTTISLMLDKHIAGIDEKREAIKAELQRIEKF